MWAFLSDRSSPLVSRLCIGCGLCERLCPNGAIGVRIGSDGYYVALKELDQCNECEACVNGCPVKGNPDLDYKLPMFYYAGYDHDVAARWASASGGVLTRLLTLLLEEKFVDGVVTAVNKGSGFEYDILCERSDIEKCKGSAYQPVYHAGILDKIKAYNGKLAFVGVPCWCELIRKLSKQRTEFKNIRFIFSLVCGHTPSINMRDFFLRAMGVEPGMVNSIRYRGDGWPGKGEIRDIRGNRLKFGHRDAWSYEFFSSFGSYGYRCLVCSDLWGSHADISFADYWDVEVSNDVYGISLICVMNSIGYDLMRTLLDRGTSAVVLEEVPFDRALKTQLPMIFYKTCVAPVIRNIDSGRGLTNAAADSNRLSWRFRGLIGLIYKTIHKLLLASPIGSRPWVMINWVEWKVFCHGVRKFEKNLFGGHSLQ